ncbi:MAG: DUF423 domain-containing protein [Myxococcales bacterium]|nr:DUF423 domain-containing protein [Myxococcales bacterium]
MSRLFLLCASGFGFLAVALGAFGAHALRSRLEPRMLEIFEVGVRYQMYHALALAFVGLALARWPQNTLFPLAGWAFVAGVAIFSGSLYVLALTGVKWLGAITPIGGVAFLVGWLSLIVAAWRAA